MEYPHHIIHGSRTLQREGMQEIEEMGRGVADFRANLGCQHAWIWNQLKDKSWAHL